MREIDKRTETALELGSVVGRLRRAVNRSLRDATAGGSRLPESQVEVLRAVAQGASRIQDVAVRLQLAHNTVSVTAQALVEKGLLERVGDAQDGRVVRLELTAVARRRLQRWREQRATTIAREVEELSVVERATLQAAIPVLAKLAEQLEQRR